MVGTKKSVAMAKRRERVMQLYLNGKYQTEIAIELGVDQSTISRDISAIHDQWRMSAIRDFDLLKQRELNRIDQLERTYWEAWEDSKELRTIKSKRQTQSPNQQTGAVELKVTEEERLGDPRYLQGIQWCIGERCRILGLHDNTQRVQLETWEDRLMGLIKEDRITYAQMVEEVGQELAADFFRRAGVPIGKDNE